MTAPAATHAAGAVLEMTGVAVPALREPSRVQLDDVNWTVQRGDYWALGGLLRSGKSDLLALAAGLTRPPRGVCRWFGQELSGGFEEEHLALRRRVGFVFDGGRLLNDQTLAENVALPLRYHLARGEAEPAERIAALVSFTDLDPWAGQRPADVSRNWQQRFGLARALALKPELLLLDDPLSGLDPRDADWWIDTLDALAAGHELLDGRPLTLVVSGNDMRPWRERARQFAVLQDRSFIVVGARDALEASSQPGLAALLRSRQT